MSDIFVSPIASQVTSFSPQLEDANFGKDLSSTAFLFEDGVPFQFEDGINFEFES